jgi:hypothetical protein
LTSTDDDDDDDDDDKENRALEKAEFQVYAYTSSGIVI